MRRLLVITYLFPPHGGGGVQRTTKFVKFLPRFGWQPMVLASGNRWPIMDESLVNDISPDTVVERVRGAVMPANTPWRLRRLLSEWVLIVDAQLGWWPFAVRRGRQMLRQLRPDAIYSTSAPYTDHLVAWRLQQNSGLPWVADFRDPWLDNGALRFPTGLHRQICQWLEGKVIENADRVIVVSEPMKRRFAARYKAIDAAHFQTITNGFDSDDFLDPKPAAGRQRLFRLVYTGSLYGPQSARTIVEAVSQMVRQGVISRNEFRLEFIGSANRDNQILARQAGLDGIVEFPGYVPHAEIADHQLGADALLLIIGESQSAEAVMTGKVFEYLAARKPILALVPPGAAADLLAEAGVAVIVAPHDSEAVAAALLDLIERWRDGPLAVQADAAVLARYERRELARQLAQALDEVSDRG